MPRASNPVTPGSTTPTPPGVGNVLNTAWPNDTIRIKGMATSTSTGFQHPADNS